MAQRSLIIETKGAKLISSGPIIETIFLLLSKPLKNDDNGKKKLEMLERNFVVGVFILC